MSIQKSIIPTLTLFGSFSTLLCCALPALFVSLGAGAALIGLVSAVPQLIWLSEHKVPLFLFAGIMLSVSGTSRFASRDTACPAEPGQAKVCKRVRQISGWVFYVSLAMYVTGVFFAFIAPRLMKIGIL